MYLLEFMKLEDAVSELERTTSMLALVQTLVAEGHDVDRKDIDKSLYDIVLRQAKIARQIKEIMKKEQEER